MDILNFPNPRKRTNKFLGPSAIHCRQTASISEMNLEKKKPVISDLFHPWIKYRLIFPKEHLQVEVLITYRGPQFFNILNSLSLYVEKAKFEPFNILRTMLRSHLGDPNPLIRLADIIYLSHEEASVKSSKCSTWTNMQLKNESKG